MKTFHLSFLAALALVCPVLAQNRTTFGGESVAIDFAYGFNQVPPLTVTTTGGNTVTGSGTITLVNAFVTLTDGTTFCPLNVNAPVLVGNGSNQETVTPISVSCGIPNGNNATITAVFANLHGADNVASASYGLQEAINFRAASTGGGVVLSSGFVTAGGTNATVTGSAPYPNVWLVDNRGDSVTSAPLLGTPPYWTMQPTTLTSLAVPATLTSTTVVFAAAPVGTWAASAYYFCVTYIDALGGEGPCSLTYNQTPTVNYSVTVTAPAASTGAVGWRLYAGASYNAAYLMPINSTHCTLSTAELVYPACAMGANGGWIAPPLTTTSLRPNATVTSGALASPTVNISAIQPQGHTTFGYQPSGSLPQSFQTHYGPFPAYGSTTTGQVDTLGSIQLPTGFLNYIGRTIRLKGKITGGSVNTAALPTLTAVVSWAGGTTAGVGLTTCSFEGVAVGATKTYTGPFECTLDTNAVGVTAVGSLMPSGYLSLQPSDVSAVAQVYSDSNVAAVGSLGLFAQDTVNIVYTSNTNTSGGPQLLSLDVEVLQ